MNPLIQKFKNEKRWVNYSLQMIEARITKIPISPITKRNASSTNPEDWSTYDQAIAVNNDAIGIIFTPDKKLLGVDLDGVLTDGKLTDETVMEFIIEANTFGEVSPSKYGLHFFFEITEPLDLIANRSGKYECYSSSRYFTVTGNTYGEEKDIRKVTPEEAIRLISILGYPWGKTTDADLVRDEMKYVEVIGDEEILQKMFSSKNGDKVKKLYDGDKSDYQNDDSSADMALCSHLAFWTGKSHIQIERIW